MSYHVKDFGKTYANLNQLKQGIKTEVKKRFPRERKFKFGDIRKIDTHVLCMNVVMPTHTYCVWIDIR